MRYIHFTLLLLILVIPGLSCEKLIEIDDPIDTITTREVFIGDSEAKAVMAGVYSTMINGWPRTHFSSGLTTLLGSVSSDDLDCFDFETSYGLSYFNTSKVLASDATSAIYWNTAYKVVYNANSILEGVAASTSEKLTASMRTQLNAEAKFLRAFSFFYLTNFYGDLPLPLTIDFNKTRNLPRLPQEKVYEQIISDLKDAQAGLPAINENQAGERIYPDKWAATALLARVYLYTGKYDSAWKQSNAVIAQVERFKLATEPAQVFFADSKEAIWQLKQEVTYGTTQTYLAPESRVLVPYEDGGAIPRIGIEFIVSSSLLNAFEPNDQRKIAWVGSTPPVTLNLPVIQKFAWKYKSLGSINFPGALHPEYNVVLRLAEQYLIRAEAAAKGAETLQMLLQT